MKFNIKRNQTLSSTRSDANIRVLKVDRSGEDYKHWAVEVINLFPNGQPMKKSRRIIFHDSVRRWYV